MENPIRRTKPLLDAENIVNRTALPGKAALGGAGLKTRSGLTQRVCLGDLSNNLSARTVDVNGKIAATTAEFEKKATISRNTQRIPTYKHVQSKIDTGLAAKAVAVPVPSARPPLRREESTASHASRAVLHKAKATIISNDKARTKDTSEATFKPPTQERKSDAEKRKVQIVRPLATRRLAETIEIKAQEEPSSPELPPNVEDIDAGDDNSPLLLSIYIKDIYRYLTHLETKYAVRPDHLKGQVAVTGRMRATLVDWLVEVQRQFNLLLETFHMTVGIIDRYLQVKQDVPRTKLQLVGVTAMFIASKYEEVYAPDVSDFVFVTDNAYSKQDILACERDIMHKLGFCLGRPLPLHFIRRFVKVALGNSRNHHLAKYLVDLCLVEYSTAHYRPSELAAAAMCLSVYLLSDGTRQMSELWTPNLEYYSGYTFDHLRPIIRQMARLLRGQDSTKLKAVQNRYRESAYASVSALPVLRGKTIENIASEVDGESASR